MSLTINLTQLKRKQRKDGTIPIYIRITEDRKSRYLSTGISIPAKDWNSDSQKVRKSHRDYKKLNRKLRQKKREVDEKRDELEQNERLSKETLKATVSGDSDPSSLIARAEKYHKSLDNTERYWEWKKFGVLLNNLRDFLGGKEISLQEVDAQFIEDFQDYLLSEVNIGKDGTPKGNSPNTVRRKLTSLKGMFIHLLKKKEIKYDPFSAIDKVKPEEANRTKLSIAQIKKIKKLDLEEGSDIWHVRNYFLYSFYNAGIRFADLCALTWGNIVDDRLVYEMNKTGSRKSIKQTEPMLQILELYRSSEKATGDYIFPVLNKKYDNPFALRKAIGSKNAQVNLLLKEVAKKAGIEANVSFHVSRHSFAHHALKKGMDLYAISKALGHSQLKVTEEYIKSFDEELLDKGMDKLFN